MTDLDTTTPGVYVVEASWDTPDGPYMDFSATSE